MLHAAALRDARAGAAMAIKPLPENVVAQIKSSTLVTSLNGVVCGLICNSLDAGSSRVNVQSRLSPRKLLRRR